MLFRQYSFFCSFCHVFSLFPSHQTMTIIHAPGGSVSWSSFASSSIPSHQHFAFHDERRRTRFSHLRLCFFFLAKPIVVVYAPNPKNHPLPSRHLKKLTTIQLLGSTQTSSPSNNHTTTLHYKWVSFSFLSFFLARRTCAQSRVPYLYLYERTNWKKKNCKQNQFLFFSVDIYYLN